MKPEYINYKEGTTLNKKPRPSFGASICKVDAENPYMWLIYGEDGAQDYGYCTTIEQAETKLFELIGNYEVYLDNHEPAEQLHNYLTNEELRRIEDERIRKEVELHHEAQAKAKAKELYQEALLIAPGITPEQYESLIIAAKEAGLFTTVVAYNDLPF